MTQPPPPPPNQPPQPPQQGGFGPPQPPQDATPQDAVPQDTPPQGAFGAPNLAKPPQPGYGYPQAPQAPQSPQGGQAPQPSQTPPPPAAAPSGPPQPPPGYGYPQAAQPGQPTPPPPPPTGTPGYGYPGQAPQAPQAPQPAASPYGQQPPAGPYGQQPPYGQPQPGYGYPGQPQPPAAYGQQPGYGYPGQPPTMPMHPQPGAPGGSGPGRKINAQVAIIVAAVVAIALIIGGGVWYSKSGDSGKKDEASSGGTTGGGDKDKGGTGGTASGGTEKAPADPASKLLFQLPMPKIKKDDSVAVRGSWLTDKAYVKTGVNEIVGYDPDKGTKLWTVTLPGPVCEASKFATEDYRTAVLFQASAADTAACDQIAAIDLSAGKQLWTKTVSSGDYPIGFDNITVSANTVALGSSDGGAAFDIASGKVLWSPKASDTCYDAGYGGGPKLVAVRKCGDYDNPTLHIQTIDPVSGKVLSEYKMTTGIEYASVVSTDPLVVAADVGDSAGDGSGISDFFSVDNKTGKLRTRISVPGDDYMADCEGITKIEACTGLAVGNDRIYVPTEEHDGTGDSYSQTNEIVAFDLGTGKQTGQRADAGDDYTIYPLRMDGSNLIAYKRPPYDKGGQIVSIDGGSFKVTKLMENPATESVRDAESGMSPEYSEVIYAKGRLYLSEVYADESTASDPEYLALAFGTSG
ncbi:PQQ-like beta-propeller repeat protein [Streptomyces sp. NBC_01275]|uniref:outer membrane protein assembly factor BamB family protein n=1 Tax=Streptomyces sp. NBC_01275 TaxID=2903807 RepID=UPI002256F37B|nr:PQQ-binding-like beta-propeller repeat protein [Streptomyces sp. NBC_01275]MCX4762715.1 PQQ-like beta-propeller repeat protein [Streptomyces sp. NBC_01275]